MEASGLLGEVRRQFPEVFAGVDAVLDDLDLLAGIFVAGGLVVLQIAGLSAGLIGDHNLSEMIGGLDEIEVSLVRVVVVPHIRVGDGDPGVDLLVDQLFLGEAAANVPLQFVQGEVRGLEFGLELLLGVGSLHLGQLRLHLGIGCGQALLGGALIDDGFEDKRMDDVQPQRVSLIRRGACCCGLLASCSAHRLCPRRSGRWGDR